MKHLIIGAMIMMFGLVSMTATASTPVSAAPNCNPRLLTFPAWYRGLTTGTNCDIKSPGEVGGLSTFIWTIVLNVLEIMIQLVAYIAAGFMIWGGYTFMRSMGDPSKVKRGKEMLFNAVIGLVLSLVAVIAVSLVVGRLTA